MPIDPEHLDRMMSPKPSAQMPPFCLKCGYNLTGAVSERCPECGEVFVRADWKKVATRLQQERQDIDVSRDWVRAGAIVAASGLSVALLCIALPIGCGESVLRALVVGAGFAAFFMGINVFRVARPHHTDGHDEGKGPPFLLGALTALFGLLDALLVLLVP